MYSAPTAPERLRASNSNGIIFERKKYVLEETVSFCGIGKQTWYMSLLRFQCKTENGITVISSKTGVKLQVADISNENLAGGS